MERWIGFNSVEELVNGFREVQREEAPARISLRHPIAYVNGTARSTTFEHSSMGRVTQNLTVQVPFPWGGIGYVRILCGQYTTNGGRPFEAKDAEEVARNYDDLLGIVAGWMARQGFRVLKATIAFPDGMTYLQGDAGSFARYDPQIRRFIEVNDESQAADAGGPVQETPRLDG